MNTGHFAPGLLIALWISALSGVAQAADIAFELTGTASGSLNGVGFSDATFDIVATGETANVFEATLGGDTAYVDYPLSMTIGISGFHGLAFTDVGFFYADHDLGYAGLGSYSAAGNLVYFSGPSFISTYILDSDVSPISVTAMVYGYSVDTDHGAVSFTSVGGAVFSAVTSVPEPGSWVMMLLGVGAVGAAFRTSRAAASRPREGY